MYNIQTRPSAVELLEASKKLYVKTDLLKERRVELGQPRLFESTDHDEEQIQNPLIKIVSINTLRIPSMNSAFRPIADNPPRPPKSEKIRQKMNRLSGTFRSPPPIPPRINQTQWLNCTEKDYSQHNSSQSTPTPKPRLSKMKSMTNASWEIENIPIKPQPKPRRKTTTISRETMDEFIYGIKLINQTPISFTNKSITKSSPNLASTTSSVAALKRKTQTSLRPATPSFHLSSAEESCLTSFVVDVGENDYLKEALRKNYSTTDDFDRSGASSPISELLTLPQTIKQLPMTSPTTDSGIPNSDHSDDERRTQPSSTKSIDDGFFDQSGHKKDEDTGSEALTSISKQEIQDVPEEEDRGRTLSILERNARVFNWIHNSSSAESV